VEIELLHECREIVFRESPLERGRDAFVIALEPQQPLLDVGERAEIGRCQCFALKNGEVDFDLVEPTGVKGTVNGDDVGKQRVKSLDAGGTSMRGSVVVNPEDASGLAVRGLGHDLGDQALKRLNAGRVLTAAEQFRAVYQQLSATPNPQNGARWWAQLVPRLRASASEGGGSKTAAHRGQCVLPPFVHSRPRTLAWSQKVDNSSGSKVAARQGLAELLTGDKNRCILVIAQMTAPASGRAPVPGPGRTISGTIWNRAAFP
jgi:hypothetical protein